MTGTSHCPHCSQSLTQVGRFWICPEHGQVTMETPFVPMRIFLSYGHDSNVELVRCIKADLEKRGHDVWFDKSQIKSGQDWRRSITDGIIISNRVLSFLSKHSTREPGVCLDEIAIAIGVKGGNIQTILVEAEQEVKPPASISHIQWLDMHDWKERREAGEDAWTEWYQTRFAEIVAVVESDETRRFAGEIKALEDYLKPVSSNSRIFQLLKKGLVGRGWLVEAIEQWRNCPDRTSRLFWIMGAPGVGKSAFAAHLAHYGRDKTIAVQFCEYDKPEQRNAHRIIRTLAFQVATRLPDYRKLLLTLPELAELERKNPSELFDYLLASPLRHVIDGGRERYLIVIDALDEAGADGRNELVEMLARNAPSLPDWIGLVVTSRPEFDVTTPLQGLSPFPMDAKTESNRADIRAYLRRELASQLEGHQDADWLVEQILTKSEGVFLYAERFCNDVQRGCLSLDRPEQFPQGLGGIFFQYFQRQFPNLEKFRKDVRPALRAILAAREPLPVGILQRIFKWQNEELCDLTRAIASLFPITTETGQAAIRPFHKSLADWLTDSSKADSYFVSVAEGHRMLADYGWEEYRRHTPNMGAFFRAHLARHMAEAMHYDRLLDLLADGHLHLLSEWVDGGRTGDGRFCLERLLSALENDPEPAGLRAALKTQLARIELREGRLDPAAALLLPILTAITEDMPKRVLAIAAHEFGSVHFERGCLLQARDWYRRSLRIACTQDPPLSQEIAANLLGIAMTYHSAYPSSERIGRLARHALQFAQKSGDLPHELEALRLLADVSKDNMDYDAAEQYLSHGLRKASTGVLPFAHMAILTVKGWLNYQRAAYADAHPSDALDTFNELLRKAEKHRQDRHQADAWCGIGQCALLAGDLELASQAVQWLEKLPDGMNCDHARVRSSLLRASLLQRRCDHGAALAAFLEGLELAHKANITARQADAHVGCGAACYWQGDLEKAEEHWSRAMTLAQPCPPIRRALVCRSITLAQHDETATPL